MPTTLTESALVANARMYSVNLSVKADWKALMQWVLTRAGLAWEIIDYDSPAPLSALWARNDLGLAMMCGLPFAHRAVRPILVAAPLPSPPRYGGKPVYFTDIVVRTDSPAQTLEDTFGGVVGYTLADSMSGGVAPYNYLASLRSALRPEHARLYRAAIGELIHARGVIDALVARRIDVGPLDSYYHDLLQLHEPAFAAQVRTIASTPAQPIPPWIATAPIPADQLARLREALLGTAAAHELQPLMQRLLLSGFTVPDAASYEPLAVMATSATVSFEEL